MLSFPSIFLSTLAIVVSGLGLRTVRSGLRNEIHRGLQLKWSIYRMTTWDSTPEMERN